MEHRQRRPVATKDLTRRAQTIRRKLDSNSKKATGHIQHWTRARLDNLQAVRRNVIWWILAVGALLILSVVELSIGKQKLLTMAVANGGSYVEGVVDKVTTLNPLFATTETETAASNLLYRGLFTYDRLNHLAGDLASTWSTTDGQTWDIKLRDDVYWSDGRKITADDVIFTLNLIKNTATGSPLRNTFAEVTATKIGDFELKFTLPVPYMSFPYSLTAGILPKHILDQVAPVDLDSYLSTNFSKTVVSGPFQYSSHVTLANGQTAWQFSTNPRFANQPKIASLTIRTYDSERGLIAGLNSGEVNAAAGISATDGSHLKTGQHLSQATLSDGVFAIFNTNSSLLSNGDLRAALRLGTDRSALRAVATVHSPKLSPVQSLETPIANGIYDSVDAMKQPAFDQNSAANKMTALGWKLNAKTGFREKDGQRLSISLVTIANSDYTPVADALADQWRQLGVDVNLTKADPSTADDEYLESRNYDVLVYDLHLGADPDETAYWSSTQIADHESNFANYSDRRADLALAAGLRQTDALAREARYDTFVQRWQENIPAIALYQPKYYYVTTGDVRGLNSDDLVSPSSRFREVSDWSVLSNATNSTP